MFTNKPAVDKTKPPMKISGGHDDALIRAVIAKCLVTFLIMPSEHHCAFPTTKVPSLTEYS